MKFALIILSIALVAHVARGMPTDATDDSKKEAQQNNATQADQSAQAPQDAAPANDKPETCKATINGAEQTLNPGDRYCVDESTHRVCNYGDWIDGKCDEGSKCLKSPTSWQVLCRKIVKNAPGPTGPQNEAPQDTQNDNAAKAPQNAPSTKEDKPQPAPQPTPSQSSQPEQPSQPSQSSNPSPPQTPAPSNPAPSTDNNTPAPPAPANTPENNPPANNPTDAPTTPKPETCKATIDGQEKTLQPGDRYCLDDNTNRVCNWGEFVDYACPSGSKCLKSPDKWQVLCRIINKNAQTQNQPSNQ